MKLRNKKTGEIITFKDEGKIALLKLVESSLPGGLSLWEEIKEPLIEDEKIRKAVKAWAESFGLNKNTSNINIKAAKDFKEFWLDGYLIEFERTMEEIQQEPCFKNYTIAELCGEEEE